MFFLAYIFIVVSFSNNFFIKEVFGFQASVAFNFLLKMSMTTLLNPKKNKSLFESRDIFKKEDHD